MASLSLSFCVGTCVMFFCLTLLLASSVSPVLGVTVNSTQNVYGMCTGPDQLGFRRYEDGQSIDCGGSLKDGTLVDSFLVRPNIPFYFIWCREAYWGFTRQPGNSSSITSLGLSPLDNNDDDTLMNVNDGGNIKNIKSYCGHTPGGVSETVANNSWTVANPTEFSNECCILTWTPPTNYSNDIYLQAAFGHTSYARLVTDAAFIPAPPKNTTAPTNSSSASSSSSSSSSSTGTSNTNTGSNSTSSSFSFTNSSSSSFSSSSSSSSSTGVTSPPSSTAQPVPGGASSSTNPTQAFVIAIVMIVCATFAQ